MARIVLVLDFGSTSSVFHRAVHFDFASIFADFWIEDYAERRISELMEEYACQRTVPYVSREMKLEVGMMNLDRLIRNISSSDTSRRICENIHTYLNLINNPTDTVLSSTDHSYFSIASQDNGLNYISESDMCDGYISSQMWAQNRSLRNCCENMIRRWQLESYIFRIFVFRSLIRIPIFQSLLYLKMERSIRRYQKSISLIEYAPCKLNSVGKESLIPILKTKIQPDVYRADRNDVGRCWKQRRMAAA